MKLYSCKLNPESVDSMGDVEKHIDAVLDESITSYNLAVSGTQGKSWSELQVQDVDLTWHEEDFSTIEMKINFLRPVKEGLITAEAKVLERGLRVGFVECTIQNARGKRVATATCTCTVVSD